MEQFREHNCSAHSRAIVRQLDLMVHCLGPDQEDFLNVLREVGRRHAQASIHLTARHCLLLSESIIRTLAFFLEDVERSFWPRVQKSWNDLLGLVFSVMRKEARRHEKQQQQKKQLSQQMNLEVEEDDDEIMEVKRRMETRQRPQSSRMLLETTKKARSSRFVDVICRTSANDDDLTAGDLTESSSGASICDLKVMTIKNASIVKKGTRQDGISNKLRRGDRLVGQSKSMRNLFSSSSSTNHQCSLPSRKNSNLNDSSKLDRVDEGSIIMSPTPATPRRRRDQAVYCSDSPSSVMKTPLSVPNGCLYSPMSAKASTTSTNHTTSSNRRTLFHLASPGLFRRSPHKHGPSRQTWSEAKTPQDRSNWP